MFLDRLVALLGAAGFGLQNADDAVGIAHRGDFRVGGDDGFIGKGQRHDRAVFNAGGRVADDEFKIHLAQLVDDFFDAFFRQRVFVARLRGGQDVEVFALLVLDQRLAETGIALDDVDEVVDHAPFAAHDEVKVAQADIKINHGGFVAAQRQPGCDCGAGGGFAHAAFAGGDYNDFAHDHSFMVGER